MRRRSHMRKVVLVIGLIGGLGVLALVAQSVVAKPLRPAATGPSPEEIQLMQLPAPAQQVGRPSKAELLARCHQRPACRAKLEAAQKGQKPATLRPAATSQSPEELEFKRLPPPATPVTPGRFQRSGLGLRPLDWLLAWLNPFRSPVAEAQQLKPLAPTPMVPVHTGVSVYLTPQNPFVSAHYGTLDLFGVNKFRTGIHFHSAVTYPNPRSENKPFVKFSFKAPATGWYIIDVRAGTATTKLYHWPSQSIIETWAAGSVPCSGGICDYATMEYLQQGFHTFDFYSPTQTYHFYSVSIESYP